MCSMNPPADRPQPIGPIDATQIPRFAGNLDIINAAAIQVAESYAADRLSMAGVEKS